MMPWSDEDRARMSEAVRRASPGPAQPAPELHATWALSPHAGEQYVGVLSYQPDKARFENGGQPAEWICGHDHPGRREAVACAREELGRRRQRAEYGLSNGIAEMDLALVPASGRPMSGMALEPDRDYPADTDLCFERGQYAGRIRLTPGDLNGLRALLTDVQGDLEPLREQARALGGVNWEYYPGELSRSVVELVSAAHAAGYRLCAAGRAPGDREAVRDFLLEQAELRAAPGSLIALERVIEMLGPI